MTRINKYKIIDKKTLFFDNTKHTNTQNIQNGLEKKSELFFQFFRHFNNIHLKENIRILNGIFIC